MESVRLVKKAVEGTIKIINIPNIIIIMVGPNIKMYVGFKLK